MHALLNILRDFPRYVWSGWGAVASVFLFIALWEWGFQQWGALVLPAPLETLQRTAQMLADDEMVEHLQITFMRGGSGFLIAAVIGSVLGLLAGHFATASMMSRPIITIFTGMPPIAWIVLAMIWFGMSDTTVVFTVVISSFPVVFVGALQGTRTLENQLNEMADSFNTPPLMKYTDVYFPHIFSYLFPALVSGLGLSWRIVVMAELLSTSDGLGASLAITRSQLDTAGALALVVIMVGGLLMVEYLLLEPIRREVEQWRE